MTLSTRAARLLSPASVSARSAAMAQACVLPHPAPAAHCLSRARSVATLASANARSNPPPSLGASLARRAALLGAGAALASTLARPALAAKAGKKLDVQRLLDEISWPPTPPFEADDFKRFDESDDAFFYEAPRFGEKDREEKERERMGGKEREERRPHGPSPTAVSSGEVESRLSPSQPRLSISFLRLPLPSPLSSPSVTHIDDLAIEAYRTFLAASIFPPSGSGAAILDLCSSWISHYPKGYQGARIAGLGMNEAELARNAALTEYTVRDLNKDPKLPYGDAEFDVITNCVSVDYLSQPFSVFAEMHRVLKPGGVAVCAFSNRMFPTKAVAVWTGPGDEDHARIIGSFFHYAPEGGWEAPQGKDITTRPFIGLSGDPMYVVWARKKA